MILLINPVVTLIEMLMCQFRGHGLIVTLERSIWGRYPGYCCRSLVCDQLDLSVGFDVFHYEACSKVIGSIACEEEQEERKKA